MDWKEKRKVNRLIARGRLDTLQRMLNDKAEAKKKGIEIRVEDPLQRFNRERQKIINKQRPVKIRAKPKFEDIFFFDIPGCKTVPQQSGSPFKSPYAFGAKLEKKGFKLLGSGAFSYVYGHPKSDRVIKITRNPDNWIDYIQWAAKNGYCGNYAPRVYSYKKIGDFEVSVVEKMKQTVHLLPDKDDYRFADKLGILHLKGNVMAGIFLEELLPGMPNFLSRLEKEFVKNPLEERLDLHAGNFMVRPDGTYCFTDPLCGKSKVTTNRLKAKDFVSLATAIRIFYEDTIRI